MNPSCACKGIRTCLLCEPFKNNNNKSLPSSPSSTEQPSETVLTSPITIPPSSSDLHTIADCSKEVVTYYYCPRCKEKAWLDQDHVQHIINNFPSSDQFICIKGVFVAENVITEEEETNLVEQIDKSSWVDSQSGRRKQDFGPKVNFKKKKVKIDTFNGFPSYIVNIFNRVKNEFSDHNPNTDGLIPPLRDFNPVELCYLEYDPSRGSSIDPHFDDDWLWGERLVTINYLSATYLTLTLPKGGLEASKNLSDVEIKIQMNPRSLLVLSSEARYKWHHSIKRSDITGRRLASTWREVTEEFKPGGKSFDTIGKLLFGTAEKIIVP